LIRIKPFKGVHPKAEYARDISCPPYDVLSSEEAADIVSRNPLSFLRVNKSELEFPPGTDPYSSQVYIRGKDNLTSLINDGFLNQDDTENYYIYRITKGNHKQTGLAALLSIEDYNSGVIKKHEFTGKDTVMDRANHIDLLNAQVGPLISAFKSNQNIYDHFDRITSNQPFIQFTADDDTLHEIWIIDNTKLIDKLTIAFSNLEAVYIADGHHRSHAAQQVFEKRKENNPHHTGTEPYNFYLNILFPADQLNIIAYNRLVKDLNGQSLEQFLQECGKSFSVKEISYPYLPQSLHSFGMYCAGKWYELVLKEDFIDNDNPIKSIDAGLLYDYLLSPILAIKDPKEDNRLKYMGGDKSPLHIQSMVDSGEYDIAFTLFPTSMQQVLDIADAGKVMPAKSTWFDPKLRSGLLVYSLEVDSFQ
jgi:uncharacterized protein (DUF1015 family)